MTLDESKPVHAHRALLGDEPEWRRICRFTDAENARIRREEMAVRDACESVEAEETKWFHPRVGIFSAQSRHLPSVHYERENG